MRPILVAIFGAIITLPAVAIAVNGVVALALWLVGLVVTIDFAGIFLMIFWWANVVALVGTLPILLHILRVERQLPA
jgi:hypothetical protein